MTPTLCDSNVWFALALSTHLHHEAARQWLERIDEPASILFCRSTQQSFLRLLTAVGPLAGYGVPRLTNEEAWVAYEALLADDRVIVQPDEPPGLEHYLRDFAIRPTASPKLWMDAYLAAFAVAGSYTLTTFDAAFRQFHDLDVVLLGGSGADE